MITKGYIPQSTTIKLLLTKEQQEILTAIINEDATFFDNEITEDIYNILFEYYMDEMPYGIMKARIGDPDKWILNQLRLELK